jgi:putative tryptophan/tyrosine transport system substrate-binding protein
MRRRELISGMGAAAAWSLAARAQQPAVPVVGYLSDSTPEGNASRVVAFRAGLSEAGFVEGRNVAIEYHWANNQPDRLPELAANLVRRRVAIIATPISTPASLAARAATSTIPIVFGIGGDPVQAGLVASLNRPGGNVTGISTIGRELGGKHVGLMHECLPGVTSFAVLMNPTNPFITESYVADARAAASKVGRDIGVFAATSKTEIDAAYAKIVQSGAGAVLVSPDGLFIARRVQLVAQAMRNALPAIHCFREDVEVGGLMSYGASSSEQCRQAGIYVGRILKGEKPADLPVLLPTKFEFVINLQTAKVLGLTVPETLLATADEVIQ